jgi:hypothetical protein
MCENPAIGVAVLVPVLGGRLGVEVDEGDPLLPPGGGHGAVDGQLGLTGPVPFVGPVV